MTEDYENLHFNTAISQLMVFINEAYKVDALPYEYIEGFVQLLAPIAPHMGEELCLSLEMMVVFLTHHGQHTTKQHLWKTK